MKKNHIIAAVSSSALASGMAHGAILYSGPINSPLDATASFPDLSTNYDMNMDGVDDFYLGFDGYGGPNSQKPYIEGYPSVAPGSAALARYDTNFSSFGLPVTPFGTMIDTNYLAPATAYAYFWQDGNAHYTGDWNVAAITEGYVGMELWDGSGNTNFGWVHLIYDGTDSPRSITVVDYGYETTPFAGIIAGATNELGAPDIYSNPPPQTVAVGANVQLAVIALGSPAPAYQWRAGPVGSGVYSNLTDGGVISGSTNATLTINGATAANVADYEVVISNSLGVVTSSPPATLTVVAPVVTPALQILFGGLTGNFYVSISGGLTPTYQWRQNGTNLSNGGRIAGATTNHLQISNLQTTDAGSYDVLLNFGSGPAPSAASPLTVLPVAGESIYEEAVLAAKPAAYYRLDEMINSSSNTVIAYDNVGGFNGVYGPDVTNGFAGVAGPGAADGFPGFAPGNAAALFTVNDTNSWITCAPWNLNTDTATLTAWVNPAGVQGTLAGVVIGTSTPAGNTCGIDYHFQVDTNTGDTDIGYDWNDEGTSASLLWDTGLRTPANQWSFVAAVVTASNATMYVFNTNGAGMDFIDGTVPNIAIPNGFTNLVMPFDRIEYIGTDPEQTLASATFNGKIDEVAVFNGAMTSNQVQTLYNAALGVLPPVNLQIALAGTSIQITWPMGILQQATNLSGPWTANYLATSPYTVTPAGSMFYRVLVH